MSEETDSKPPPPPPKGVEEPEVNVFSFIYSVYGKFKSIIYDITVANTTHLWYEAMLEELDEGDIVLDVGIGTAGTVVQS